MGYVYVRADEDVTSNEQYQENLKAYRKWLEKDQSTDYTMLYCMHDDLMGKFGSHPIAEYIWDQPSIRLG